MDRWDVVGGLGIALVTVSIRYLAGPAWDTLFVGVLLMALYILREVRK